MQNARPVFFFLTQQVKENVMRMADEVAAVMAKFMGFHDPDGGIPLTDEKGDLTGFGIRCSDSMLPKSRPKDRGTVHGSQGRVLGQSMVPGLGQGKDLNRLKGRPRLPAKSLPAEWTANRFKEGPKTRCTVRILDQASTPASPTPFRNQTEGHPGAARKICDPSLPTRSFLNQSIEIGQGLIWAGGIPLWEHLFGF
jgi:hypothetical protein